MCRRETGNGRTRYTFYVAGRYFKWIFNVFTRIIKDKYSGRCILTVMVHKKEEKDEKTVYYR